LSSYEENVKVLKVEGEEKEIITMPRKEFVDKSPSFDLRSRLTGSSLEFYLFIAPSNTMEISDEVITALFDTLHPIRKEQFFCKI